MGSNVSIEFEGENFLREHFDMLFMASFQRHYVPLEFVTRVRLLFKFGRWFRYRLETDAELRARRAALIEGHNND